MHTLGTVVITSTYLDIDFMQLNLTIEAYQFVPKVKRKGSILVLTRDFYRDTAIYHGQSRGRPPFVCELWSRHRILGTVPDGKWPHQHRRSLCSSSWKCSSLVFRCLQVRTFRELCEGRSAMVLNSEPGQEARLTGITAGWHCLPKSIDNGWDHAHTLVNHSLEIHNISLAIHTHCSGSYDRKLTCRYGRFLASSQVIGFEIRPSLIPSAISCFSF